MNSASVLASLEMWQRQALGDLRLSHRSVKVRESPATVSGLVSGRGACSSSTTGGGAAIIKSHALTESATEMGGPGCVAVTSKT